MHSECILSYISKTFDFFFVGTAPGLRMSFAQIDKKLITVYFYVVVFISGIKATLQRCVIAVCWSGDALMEKISSSYDYAARVYIEPWCGSYHSSRTRWLED